MNLTSTPSLRNLPHARFFLALCLGLFLSLQADQLVVTPVHADEAPATAPAAPAEGGAAPAASAHHSKSLLDIIKEGGWIMFPLIGISVWCSALIIEGFIRIRLVNFSPPDVVRQLKQAFDEENYQQAWRICKGKNSFLTNALKGGLERIGRGRSAAEQSLAEHSLRESMIYKTKISYLSTIGVISPMVGLLGTVTGMIKAFQTLGTGGIGDPSLLAAAIGEVLIATATGLLVAIPAFFLYYFFKNRLQSVITLSEDVMNQLMVDVKYEELQGIKIGESLEAELARGGPAPLGAGGTAPPAGVPTPAAAGGLGNRVSQAISGVTMACPQCNAAITAGAPRCNSCGTELQWS